MKDRILPLAAIVLAVAALGLAATGNPHPGSAYWVTTRPIAAGSKLTRADVAEVRVSGPAVPAALPASRPLPSMTLKSSLPPGSFVVRSDFGTIPSDRRVSEVEVPIPVGALSPGLAKGAIAVVAAWGNGEPPQVISQTAPVVGVSGSLGEATAVVALPLIQAEQVLAALSAGKVAVLPWQP